MSHPWLKRDSRRKARGVSGFEALEDRIALTASAASDEVAAVASSEGTGTVFAIVVAYIDSGAFKPDSGYADPAAADPAAADIGDHRPPPHGFNFPQMPGKTAPGASLSDFLASLTTSPLGLTDNQTVSEALEAVQAMSADQPERPPEPWPFAAEANSFVANLTAVTDVAVTEPTASVETLTPSTVAARDAVWAAVGDELDHDQLRLKRRSEIEDALNGSFAGSVDLDSDHDEDRQGLALPSSDSWMQWATERARLNSVLQSLRELKSPDEAAHRATERDEADSSQKLDDSTTVERAQSAAEARPDLAELVAGMIAIEATGDPNQGAGESLVGSLNVSAGAQASAGPLPLRLIQDIDVGSYRAGNYGPERTSVGQRAASDNTQAAAATPTGDGGSA